MRTLTILHLRWQAFWTRVQLEIDEHAIATHTPSAERCRARIAHMEFRLAQLHAPRSLIMQALRRAGK